MKAAVLVLRSWWLSKLHRRRSGGFQCVAVLDSKARPVKGLSKGNIRLFEDGKEQAIQFVRPEDIPATVGLVIDNSGSMRRKRAEVVQAAQESAELSNSEDELFIVNFNERVTMGLPGGAPFTSDRDQFRTALQATRADGKTALYDAVVSALRHVETGTHQKKALIVLSDGGDNASAAGLPDVLKASERSNATLYKRPNWEIF